MSDNVRYSITVDVPEGMNPVTFKSKIESLYENMSESPADEVCHFKNCFKIYFGKPCIVENGAVTAFVCEGRIKWENGTAFYRPSFPELMQSCSDDERTYFLKASDKSGLKVSWKKDKGVFIQEKFNQGDLVSFGPRCWGEVEGWRDGMVTVLWYLDKEMSNLHEGYHQIEDASNARLLTDGEKELLDYCLSALGYKIVNGRLKEVRFRAEEGEPFYALSFSPNGIAGTVMKVEKKDKVCEQLWKIGNYFCTENEAREAIDMISNFLTFKRKNKE